MTIGGREVVLEDADVYREAIAPDGGHLHANVGRDVIDRFDEAIVDFRSMSFLLR